MTNAPRSEDLRAAALDYAARNWRVVLLHDIATGKCSCGRECGSSAGKHPRLKSWPENASSDADQIVKWWTAHKFANVGVALGTLSGIVAVDIDSSQGEEILATLANGDLPLTLEMTTSAGKRRLLYSIPDSLEFDPKTCNYANPEGGGEAIRFQGTGAQCVMPPSLHPSGVQYAWVSGRSPAEIAVAPMPAWMIAEMAPPPEPVATPAPTPAPAKSRAAGIGDQPEVVANFNRDADWMIDVLAAAGWKHSRTRPDGVIEITRPGKDGGTSATIGHHKAKDGSPALHVFTGSVAELPPGHCWDKFGCYARLWHGGDHAAAMRALAATGKYGVLRGKPPATVSDASQTVAASVKATATAAAVEPWGEPIPLDDFYEMPPFPLHVFPQALVDLISQAAESVGCPVDYGATHALGIAGGVIGGAFDLQVKRGHWQSPNLWICVIAPPGSGKSPAVAPLLAPVYAEQVRRSAEGSNKHTYVSDVTVEKLAGLLQEHHRGLLMIWDEMAGWLTSFNQYKAKGGGNDRTQYLSIWDGRVLKSDRKANDSPPVFVRYPRLSVVGGIQPDVLNHLREGPSDGLFDRMLFCYPNDKGLAVETFAEIDPDAEAEWSKALRVLWDLPTCLEEIGGKPRPGCIKLTDEGRPVWQAWTLELHEQASKPDTPPYFRQVAAKLQGYAARLALVVHLLRESYGLAEPHGVGAEGMTRGVELARYFLAHADRVHRLAGHDHVSMAAKFLVTWLSNNGCDTFTQSDVWASVRRNPLFAKSSSLQEPLKLLKLHRCIRWKEQAHTGAGRPSQGTYEVNPALLGRELTSR